MFYLRNLRLKKKCIIITGATGFIGSHTTKLLIKRGYHVVVLTRESSNFERLSDIVNQFDLLLMTSRNRHLVKKLSTYSPVAWIECAWHGVSGKERNAMFQVSDNVPRIINSVRLASQIGCKTWVGLGSQAEYGNINCICDEKIATSPTTLYGMAKLSACWATLGMCESLGIRSVWLRVFSTYGPDDHDYWLIPTLIRDFLNNRRPRLTLCEQMWDYLYVVDAARAILSCIESISARGIYNLGSGKVLLLRDLVEKVQKLCDVSQQADFGAINYRDDQVMHLEANIDKLKNDTGWTPSVSFDEGLKLVVDSYLGKK